MREHVLIQQRIHELLLDYRPVGKVLGVGSSPHSRDLLNLGYFRDSPESFNLVGINLGVPGQFGNFEVIQGDAHKLPFSTASFSLVLCNSMLEHDHRFWLTLVEIRRVLRLGGMFIAATPGFTADNVKVGVEHDPYSADTENASLTFKVHGAPQDYYRFSRHAYEEVVFDGFGQVAIEEVMIPPRILGYGFKL